VAGRSGEEPGAELPVGGVDAGRVHAHQSLTGAWTWIGAFDDFEDIGTAEVGELNRESQMEPAPIR
jgi:hypothetical protein